MALVEAQGRTQFFSIDASDSGEGLAVFFSQNANDTARYRFLVSARTSQGVFQVGEFYSSPPNATVLPGALTRMIAGAICPGAQSWDVEVSCMPDPFGAFPAETANIILTSGLGGAGQIGVKRVNERYHYVANAGTQNTTVFPGRTVTSIGAIGLTGGGSVQVGGGDLITVPDGIGVNLEPGTLLAPNTVLHFLNVDWAVEFLESA